MSRFVEIAVMGTFALAMVAYEGNFVWRTKVSRAVVFSRYVYSSRLGFWSEADVDFVVERQPVRASLRAWFQVLRPGQNVSIRYVPDDSKYAALNEVWLLFPGSISAIGVFGLVGFAGVMRLRAARRRQGIALLSDDYAPPRINPRAAVRLPIDTKPRLWDKELDG